MSARGAIWLRAAAVAAAVAGLLACRERTEASPAMRPPALHTDTAGLAVAMEVPEGTTSARWVVAAASPPGLGPTDTRVYAFLTLAPAAWTALEARVGATSPRRALTLPDAVATVLLPLEVLTTLPSHDGARRVEGPGYSVASLRRATYGGDTGVRLGDALVVVLSSR